MKEKTEDLVEQIQALLLKREELRTELGKTQHLISVLSSNLPRLSYVERYATYGNDKTKIIFAGSRDDCIAFVEAQEGWLHELMFSELFHIQPLKKRAYIDKWKYEGDIQCYPRKKVGNEIYARIMEATPLHMEWSEIEALANTQLK